MFYRATITMLRLFAEELVRVASVDHSIIFPISLQLNWTIAWPRYDPVVQSKKMVVINPMQECPKPSCPSKLEWGAKDWMQGVSLYCHFSLLILPQLPIKLGVCLMVPCQSHAKFNQDKTVFITSQTARGLGSSLYQFSRYQYGPVLVTMLDLGSSTLLSLNKRRHHKPIKSWNCTRIGLHQNDLSIHPHYYHLDCY